MKRQAAWALGLVFFAIPALADEIRLKDGAKITGTIVGFEESSFRVQTSYGFALVRKDRIAAIIPAEPKPETKKKEASLDSKKPPSPPPEAPPAPTEAAAASPAPAPPAKKEASPPARVAPSASTSTPAPPAPTSAPPAPAPAPVFELAIKEEVQGNLYINHTYGFRMYKPPGWHIIEGAQKTLPTAVVAMGTGDETTLLVVGRERMKDSLETHAAATEKQLRETYENYRRLSERRSLFAGMPAFERRYRGTVEGRDWSGTVLSLARGNEVFTILGITYADSDLIQIQENVISKAIASLEFTAK
jgi:hypothetical protein